MTYKDEKNVQKRKNVVLLDANEGDFVGEESLSETTNQSQYSVKVASREGAEVYVADTSAFISTFKNVLPEIKKMW